MARVTVEDCLKVVPNRFELVLLAAKRARQLTHGHETTLPMDNDKFTVIALREIELGVVDVKELRAEFTKPVEEEPEEMEPNTVEAEARALLVEATAIPLVNISDDADDGDVEEEDAEVEEEDAEVEEEDAEVEEEDDAEDEEKDVDMEDDDESFLPANDFPGDLDLDEV